MEHNAKFLTEQAERCRRLAGQITDRELAHNLLALGEEYAQRARQALSPIPREKMRPIETAH